jgi:drug/metabolite transporter (DMT)-like permease
MQLAGGALWVFAASTLRGDLAHFSVARLDARTDLALLFLVLCGTVIAFASYTWLLRVASPAAVSSYAFVNPMVALALGVAVGDDALSGRILLSAALVIAAVALTRGNAPASRSSRVEVADTSLRVAS